MIIDSRTLAGRTRVTRVTAGTVLGEIAEGSDFDELFMNEVIVLDGSCVDADVTLGQGKAQVSCRLVMIPGPSGHLIHLILLNIAIIALIDHAWFKDICKFP